MEHYDLPTRDPDCSIKGWGVYAEPGKLIAERDGRYFHVEADADCFVQMLRHMKTADRLMAQFDVRPGLYEMDRGSMTRVPEPEPEPEPADDLEGLLEWVMPGLVLEGVPASSSCVWWRARVGEFVLLKEGPHRATVLREALRNLASDDGFARTFPPGAIKRAKTVLSLMD